MAECLICHENVTVFKEYKFSLKQSNYSRKQSMQELEAVTQRSADNLQLEKNFLMYFF